MISIRSSTSAASAGCAFRDPSVLRRVTMVGHTVWGSSPPSARAFGGDRKSVVVERVTRKATTQDEADIAEADARAAIAKASVSKATAEASKATAEAAAAVRRSWLFSWAAGVAAIAVCGLTLDFLWHENEAVIKWNMARTLRACKLPPTVPVEQVPAVRLETRQPALQETFLVTMLGGPTGCGKSTVMKDLVRKFIAARIPTIFISFCKLEGHGTPKGSPSAAEALELMDATAKRVFDQVGFPTRRSCIAAKPEGTATLVPSGSRLIKCFTYVFDVAETVAMERQAAGKKDLAGAVVLAFDGPDGLAKDARLRLGGGQLVLDHLSSLVDASVGSRFAQIYLAGSSARRALSDSHVAYVYQADPSREAMLEALTGRGYTSEDATRMVNFCGTRLRLFEGPLTWKTPPTTSDFIASSTLTAEGAFLTLPTQCRTCIKLTLMANFFI